MSSDATFSQPSDESASPGEVAVLRRRWPLVAGRGAASLALGVAALLWVDVSEQALVTLFGAFAVIAGVVLLVDAVRIAGSQRPVLAAEGVVSAVVGLVALVWPDPDLAVLVAIVGGWAVLTGILETVAALAQRGRGTGTYVPVLAGITAVVLGALLFIRQDLELPAVAVLIGAYAAAAGGLLIGSGLRLRAMSED